MKARANFKASLTERKFAVKTKDAKTWEVPAPALPCASYNAVPNFRVTRSVYTETFINMAVAFMCMNESEDKVCITYAFDVFEP